MRIGYGIRVNDWIERFDSYAEATKMSEVWLLIDGTPIIPLPATFNRCMASGGSKINTAVLNYTEIENGDNALPLPDEAPFLIFDFDHGRVDWLPQGVGRRVINLYEREAA